MNERRRGRPRAYDPDAALDAALEAFWERGFAGTSLDEISAATGMGRPSLYAAFGDKKSIYRKSIDKFSRDFLGRLTGVLFAGAGIEEDLVNFFSAALETYRSGHRVARGCPVLCTASTAAAVDDDIRSDLAAALDQIDGALVSRFERAREQGEIARSADAKRLGMLAAALLHSLALRTRARQKDFQPEAFVRTSIAEILKP